MQRTIGKPEAAAAVVELLMLGMRMPETCWAVFKRQAIKLRDWCSWLVDLFEYVMMHGLTNPKDENVLLTWSFPTALCVHTTWIFFSSYLSGTESDRKLTTAVTTGALPSSFSSYARHNLPRTHTKNRMVDNIPTVSVGSVRLYDVTSCEYR
jgi:hypothetical protein